MIVIISVQLDDYHCLAEIWTRIRSGLRPFGLVSDREIGRSAVYTLLLVRRRQSITAPAATAHFWRGWHTRTKPPGSIEPQEALTQTSTITDKFLTIFLLAPMSMSASISATLMERSLASGADQRNKKSSGCVSVVLWVAVWTLINLTNRLVAHPERNSSLLQSIVSLSPFVAPHRISELGHANFWQIFEGIFYAPVSVLMGRFEYTCPLPSQRKHSGWFRSILQNARHNSGPNYLLHHASSSSCGWNGGTAVPFGTQMISARSKYSNQFRCIPEWARGKQFFLSFGQCVWNKCLIIEGLCGPPTLKYGRLRFFGLSRPSSKESSAHVLRRGISLSLADQTFGSCNVQYGAWLTARVLPSSDAGMR